MKEVTAESHGRPGGRVGEAGLQAAGTPARGGSETCRPWHRRSSALLKKNPRERPEMGAEVMSM